MSRRYQDSWGDYRRDREDISMAAAFFMTFALLALVAWVIFFGTGWIVPAALDAIPSRATHTPAAYSTSAAPASGISFPLVTTTTPAASPTKPATANTTAARTSSSTSAAATPTPTPSAATTPAKLRIANTGGDGVYLRRTASESDTWIPWPDNTVLEYLNQDQQNGGTLYKKVKDPRGNVGWMPAQYLVPAQ